MLQNKSISNARSRIPVPKKIDQIQEQKPIEKKKKRKSTLFAPTCSRMAQEAENFNNRAKINRQKKSNTQPVKKQTPLKPNNTCLPKKDPIDISKNNKQNYNIKSEYLQLKKKIREDEKLIIKQTEEITKLKKLVTNTMHVIEIAEKETHLETRKKELELQFELLEKVRLDKKLESVAVQTESCNAYIVDLLEVSSTSNTDLRNEINRLQKQLETQENKHKLKLDEYDKLLSIKDRHIQQQQIKYENIKKDHKRTIKQLNELHFKNIKRIESKTKTINDNDKKTTTIVDEKTLENELERILIEFEQEQHLHPVIPKKDESSVQSHCNISRKHNSVVINQQWWSKQYIPTDAATWPSPQPLSNLRKPCLDKRYCI